jgi:hypothetical protein
MRINQVRQYTFSKAASGSEMFDLADGGWSLMLKEGRKRRVKFLASYLSQLDTSELSDIERAGLAVQKASVLHQSANLRRDVLRNRSSGLSGFRPSDEQAGSISR